MEVFQRTIGEQLFSVYVVLKPMDLIMNLLAPEKPTDNLFSDIIQLIHSISFKNYSHIHNHCKCIAMYSSKEIEYCVLGDINNGCIHCQSCSCIQESKNKYPQFGILKVRNILLYIHDSLLQSSRVGNSNVVVVPITVDDVVLEGEIT